MTSKTKIFALVAVCSISLFSCKKDYDCVCSLNFDTSGLLPFPVTQTTKIEKTNKKGAESTCDNIESNLSIMAFLFQGTVDCKID